MSLDDFIPPQAARQLDLEQERVMRRFEKESVTFSCASLKLAELDVGGTDEED